MTVTVPAPAKFGAETVKLAGLNATEISLKLDTAVRSALTAANWPMHAIAVVTHAEVQIRDGIKIVTTGEPITYRPTWGDGTPVGGRDRSFTVSRTGDKRTPAGVRLYVVAEKW